MAKTADIVVVQHAQHEGLGSFREVCLKLGHRVREVLSPMATEEDWRSIREAPVLFVMGGAMGVYEQEKFPFLKKEIEILKHRINSDAPTMGICLGAQLLAAAAGARVYLAENRREVGWFELSATENADSDPLLQNLSWKNPVFHWHQDTFDSPPGAVHLLRSERFEQQAFRIKERLYGLQFHPEVEAVELEHWIDAEAHLSYGNTDGVQTREAILRGGGLHGGPMRQFAHVLVSRFLQLL